MKNIRGGKDACWGRVLAGAALAGAVAPALAQGTPPKELPPITVKGGAAAGDPSLTLPNIDTARERIGTIPGGANVIDGDSYREGRVATLNDSLAYSPGVFSASRFGAEEARLSIRGSGLQRTFHLRGIKLMQDGVPLNLADGSGDFQSIEPLHTRYIEVYRGANALQYGAATLGGAINYVSVTGHDNWPLLLRGEVGSFDYRRMQVTGGAVLGELDWAATYSTFDQDGFRDHAVQHAQRATANLGYRFSREVETRFFFSYANSDSELPGNLTKAQLQANPEQANPGNITGDQKRDIDWYRVSNRTVLAFGSSRLELHGWYLEKTLFHPIFQVLDQKNKDGGAEARWVSEAPLGGRRNILTAGIAGTHGTTEEDRWVNVGGARGARTNRFEQVASNVELYAENQHYWLPRTAFVAGAQYSRNRRENDDQFVPAGQGDESFDQRYSRFSPKVGVRHEFSPAVQVFANYSGSYEPPSFGELVGGLNPNLVAAQKAKTFEVGSRGLLASLTWDVALYHAKVEDELLQTLVFPAGNNPVPSPQTVNVPRTIHQGLELGTSGRFWRSFEWRQALFVNRFKFDDDPTFGDNTLPGLPKSFFKGELLYRAPYGVHFAVNVERSPSRYPVDMANTLFADPYTVWGARVGQKVGAHWYWFVEGRNLGDETYAATTGVTRNQAGLDGAQFLPGDGRSVYAGLEYRL